MDNSLAYVEPAVIRDKLQKRYLLYDMVIRIRQSHSAADATSWSRQSRHRKQDANNWILKSDIENIQLPSPTSQQRPMTAPSGEAICDDFRPS